jgi:hypothetical protein
MFDGLYFVVCCIRTICYVTLEFQSTIYEIEVMDIAGIIASGS